MRSIYLLHLKQKVAAGMPTCALAPCENARHRCAGKLTISTLLELASTALEAKKLSDGLSACGF